MKSLPKLTVLLILIINGVVYPQSKFDVRKSLSEAASYLQTGNFAEAEKILLRAEKLAPNNSDVYNLLGIIYDQRGDFVKAENTYLKAIKLNPKAISPLANFGVLLVKLKREKDAIRIFETVLKINPNHPQTIINLGFLYFSSRDFSHATEFLGKANLIQPNSYDILFKLGAALYQTKKFEEARQIFVTISTIPEPLYYLGLIDFEQNNFENAARNFENVLTLKPDFADANFMLGEILAKQKRYAEAIQFYQKAITQDKTKDVYFVRLGGIYLLNSKFNEALPYFKEASQLFPKVAEIRYFLAITFRGLGENNSAIDEIKKALAIKPTADFYALLGAILADRNEFSTAEINLRKAIQLNPNHFNSHYDLGRMLVKNQKFAEALPLLQKASVLIPNNADVHYQLFLIYSRLKRKAEADKEFTIFKQLSGK